MSHDRTREGSGRPRVSVSAQTYRQDDTGTDAVTVGSQSDGMRESKGITETTVSTPKARRDGPNSCNKVSNLFPGSSMTLPCTKLLQSWKRRSRLLRKSEQLLPGIPDDVTLHEITTKLPWAAFQILASVSPRSRQPIHSREVYDARIRCHSTKTLVLLESSRLDTGSLGLYSMSERSSHQLPPIPYLKGWVPAYLRSVSLDGKMYVLGGDSTVEEYEDYFGGGVNGRDTYVLDVIGSMKWKQCASMLEPREYFGCGVLDGKIYVFGGACEGKLVRGSEVYDPKTNVWSSIQPMKVELKTHHSARIGEGCFVFGPHVVTIGDELFVYGKGNVEVYHTVRNEWRVIERFGTQQRFETLFAVQGKLHMFTTLGIYVHDTDSNSWRQRHSNSFPTLGPVDSISILPFQIVVENDQLLLGICWYRNIDTRDVFRGLLRSRGFGSKIEEIVWEKAASSLHVGEPMCSIQL